MGRPVVLMLERDAQAIGVAVRELGPPAEPGRHGSPGEGAEGERGLRRLAGPDEGYELHVARTVELALRIAARRNVAVALLDTTIAGSGLADLVQRLRQHSPGARVVLLSDFAQDRKNPLGPMLMKPLHEGRLADAVRTAVRLRQMNEGVERMRSSSGTFAAVRLGELPAIDTRERPAEREPQRTPSSPRVPAQTDPPEAPLSTRGRAR